MGADDYSKWSCQERGKQLYTLGHNDLRRWYQRDIDQIVHSTAFRKLQRKTQLLSEKDPRVRSRLIHTLEVSRIAVEISEKLGLDKELTEAICMGHDLGTSPYGYIGNVFLSGIVTGNSFSHEIAGTHMLETLAIKKLTDTDLINRAFIEFNNRPDSGIIDLPIKEFPGNLKVSRKSIETKDVDDEFEYFTYHISPEVLDGVRCHGGADLPQTLEAQVVKFSDNIAYLSQDIDDLMYSKILQSVKYTNFNASSLPLEYTDKFGVKHAMTWDEIDNGFENCKLRDAFQTSRGLRIAAFITRYVNYNKMLLVEDKENKLDPYQSPILKREIPKLQLDKGLDFIIDFTWCFIEKYYKDALICTSNEIQRAKIQQLWSILDYKKFTKENKFYKKFMSDLDDSRFISYSEAWKKAYFISHLAYDEVDLIITSFHQRDFTFEIDIREAGNENC